MKIEDFGRIQEIIRKDLIKAIDNNNIIRIVRLVETFAEVTLRINNIKSDFTIEKAIQALSQKYIGQQPNLGRKSNLIVFYDQVGTTICLGLQYLRGIIAAGYDVVYVYENYRNEISPALLNEIKALDIEYKLFGPSSLIYGEGVFCGKKVSEYINSLSPAKIVMHPLPNEAIGMSVLYSLPHIEKFIVVPGDHHYYAGFHSADYLIEFRTFGIGVSVNERGIDSRKIYKLPYYPIVDEFTEFQGFPVDTAGKITFFSAGATYKFMGSDTIYNIWDYILGYDNTLILYMGIPDKKLKRYVKENKYEKRFVFLGYRKDFVQCVKNADVLVNSYPIGGGLVVQTAAYFEKPIVAYCNQREYFFQNVTDILGGDGSKDRISKTSLEEGKKLIDDLLKSESYRREFGQRMKQCLQTKDCFDNTLHRILSHSIPSMTAEPNCSDDDYFIMDRYLCQQNNWHPTVFVPLIIHYGFSFFWKFRFLYKDIIKNPVYVIKFLTLYLFNVVKKH